MPEHTGASERETNPSSDIAAWLDAALPAGMPCITLIGGARGLRLAALDRRSPGVRVVIVEPHADAARALEGDPDTPGWRAAERLAVLTGPDYGGGALVARQFKDAAGAPVLVHPRLAASHPDDVLSARRAASRLLFQASANDEARRASAGRYLLQTLANSPRIARESDVSVLASLFTGIPAVIVAAGPTLDRNVHALKEVADHAIVIACDTAAWPLASYGVEPDFIVAADSSRANAAHLSALPPCRSWLVAEGSLHPSAFTLFDHRTFFFRVADHEPWPWLHTMGIDSGHLETWGSIATSAFSFALGLGCNPIAFIGADFAFTGNRPYCRGTSLEPLWATWAASGLPPEEAWPRLVDHWPLLTEPDIHGTPVRTAAHLVSFRDWIVDHAASHRDRRVINATGAGLLAGASIEHATLPAVLAGRDTIDRPLLHRVIRAAHQQAGGDLAILLDQVTRLLSGGSENVIARWIAFAGAAVGYPAIEAALRSHEHAVWQMACHAVARDLSRRNHVP